MFEFTWNDHWKGRVHAVAGKPTMQVKIWYKKNRRKIVPDLEDPEFTKTFGRRCLATRTKVLIYTTISHRSRERPIGEEIVRASTTGHFEEVGNSGSDGKLVIYGIVTSARGV